LVLNPGELTMTKKLPVPADIFIDRAGVRMWLRFFHLRE
jgi:hypothetical protein